MVAPEPIKVPVEIDIDTDELVTAINHMAEVFTACADAMLIAAERLAYPRRTVNVIDDPKSTAARLLGGADDPTGHRFEAGEGSSGMVCTRMVMRDGGGDACGATPGEHRG